MPNIKGEASWYSMGRPERLDSSFTGVLSSRNDFSEKLVVYSGGTQNKGTGGLYFDASENGKKSVWKDGASVKSRNFTYKIWTRKF